MRRPTVAFALLLNACAMALPAWAQNAVPAAPVSASKPESKPAPKALAARLPQRDLTVELRQIEEGGEGSSYSAGSAQQQRWEPQMVQVRNGERARLQLQDAVAMQWTESVSSQSANLSAGGASASSQGASAKQALQWFDAGQSMSVSPRWPGGNSPAVLEMEVQRSSLDTRADSNLPAQTRHSVSTTVTVPLAQWVTIAATGRLPQAHTYSSEAALQKRRLLQVRVMAP